MQAFLSPQADRVDTQRCSHWLVEQSSRYLLALQGLVLLKAEVVEDESANYGNEATIRVSLPCSGIDSDRNTSQGGVASVTSRRQSISLSSVSKRWPLSRHSIDSPACKMPQTSAHHPTSDLHNHKSYPSRLQSQTTTRPTTMRVPLAPHYLSTDSQVTRVLQVRRIEAGVRAGWARTDTAMCRT